MANGITSMAPLATSVATKKPVPGSITSYSPQPLATSVATKQPVAGSISSSGGILGNTRPAVASSSPVDISGFTDAQKAAFSNAASLGKGVQTTQGMVGGNTTASLASSPYSYNASGTLVANPNAVAGTAGSAAPSASVPKPTITPGTLGTGSPADIAANQTAGGILGNYIGKTNTLYNQNAAALQPSIKQNQDIIAQATAEEEALTGGSYSGTAADYSGRMAQLENIKQNAQANVNAAVSNLNTSMQTAGQAYQTGVGAATQYQNVPFGQPIFNPLTGTYSMAGGTGTGAGGVGLTYNPQTDISAAVKAIQANPSLYNSYQSAIASGYGANGSTIAGQLDTALLQAGMNPTDLAAKAQSSAQNISTAATQTAGQSAQLQKAGSYALQTLNDLQGTYQNLMGTQTTPIPAMNSISTWLSNTFGVGASQTAMYNTSLQEARAAVSNALSAAGNTPSFSDSTAVALLPDNASPQQIEGAVSQIQQLMGQKISAYGTPSSPVTSPTSPASATGGTAFDDASFYGTGQ